MSATTHLLVDGSNVVHAWPETKTLMRQDREAARRLLVRRLAPLHDGAGWRVTVVFDGRSDTMQIEPVGGAADFACIYTPAGTTADDVIEQLVSKAADPSLCLVATADQAERSTVEAAGATWCSPTELAERINAQDTRTLRSVSEHNALSGKVWKAKGSRP